MPAEKTKETAMTPDEQRNLVTTAKTELTTYWSMRDNTLRADRDIINLTRAEKKEGQSNWITNEPKVFFDLSRSLVSINPPQYRLPIVMDAEAGEKDRMNKAERLCIGIMRNLNEQVVDKGGINWLWDLAYYVLLGWFSVFSVVEKSYEGVRFTADVLDPLTVFPRWDSYGLAECVRHYQTDKITAKAMMESFIAQEIGAEDKEPIATGEQYDITSYWKRDIPVGKRKNAVVQNAIVIGGRLAKPFTHQTKMRRIPIHVGAIGSPDRVSAIWMKRKGESVIAANREVYEYLNQMLQLEHEVAKENTYPNRIWHLQNVQGPLPKARGYGEDIRLKVNEKLELVRTSTTPQEVEHLSSYFGRQAQKGSVADMTYGGSQGVELSGFAISQLLAAVKYKLGMYLNGMQSITGRVMSDFLYQYRMGNYGELTMSTENPHDMRRGMTYIEEYGKDDIPKHIFVEVSIPISSQFDKTQAILNAVQAKQNGILSRETIWENAPELGVQDKELEKRRIRDDEVDADPFFRDIEVIQGMWDKEKFYRESGQTEYADAMKNYITLKEQGIGIGKPQPVVPGSPGDGINPEVAPPEAITSPNPDQLRAMKGQAPPSPNRPVNPANQGRKGVLVSPEGKQLI